MLLPFEVLPNSSQGSGVQEGLIEKLSSARVAHVGQEVEGVRGRTDAGRGQDASGCVAPAGGSVSSGQQELDGLDELRSVRGFCPVDAE